MEETEIHILEGLRKRSPKAQQQAIELYGSYVWDLIVRLVPRVEDAEEVYQDIFVKAFSNIYMYNEDKSIFKTWLSRIAYNECITFLRRKRQSIIYFEDNEGKGETLSEAEVEETLGHPNYEIVQLVRIAIKYLPPDEQAIITMFYYDEMSLKEIAYVTKSIPTTVASKLTRIRRKLCKIIKMLQL